MRPLSVALIVVLGAWVVSGCVQAQHHLSADFGLAVRQDAAAQVADPDAVYKARPPANGARVGLAMDRYQTGKVTEPQATSTKIGPALGAPTGP